MTTPDEGQSIDILAPSGDTRTVIAYGIRGRKSKKILVIDEGNIFAATNWRPAHSAGEWFK